MLNSMIQNQGQKASSKVTRAGLAKIRPLTPQENTPSTQPPTKGNLPNGWYYNEPKESTFWDDIEAHVSKERQEKIEETTKQTDYMTQMGDTSNRIRNIISQIDDIDQETLLAMMAIADEANDNGDSDPNLFLDDSRNQILAFITEIRELSESQQSLAESLRSWFSSLQDNETFFENEKNNQPDAPDKSKVYEFLSSIVEQCGEKSEKAACLHNDVSDFWTKQVGAYKRIILGKEEEIHKLKDAIEQAAAARAKRTRQKQAQKVKIEDVNAKNEQIENQMRTIEEQKMTIEKLKKQLQSNEMSIAALNANRSINSGDNGYRNNGGSSDYDINNAKYEFETKLAILNERIAILTKDNEKTSASLNEERGKLKKVEKILEEKNLYIQELEANNQKNLKLLALEQEKNTAPPPPPPDIPSENEDHLLEIVQMQEDIKRIKQQHQQELLQQQDLLRAKFLIERDKLFEAMSTTENGALIKGIVDDYEKKLLKQKEDYDNMNNDLIRSWGAKLSILTRQYENRIKAINASNEVEFIGVKENANYLLKKKELDLEEEFNKRILEANRERSEKFSEMQVTIDHLRVQIEFYKFENSKLRHIAKKYAVGHPDLKREFDQVEHRDDDADDDNEDEVNMSSNLPTRVDGETKLIEKQIIKLQVLKEETENSTKWLLEKQKDDFERKTDKSTCLNQKNIRELMLKIQDSLSKLTVEGETPISLDSALQNLADLYVLLNKQIEDIQGIEQATIPVPEVNERMKEYNERIQQLAAELRSRSENVTSSKGNNEDHEKEKEELEQQIAKLKEQVKFLEFLGNVDNKTAIESLKKAEEELKEEIAIKDALISHYQKRPLVDFDDFDIMDSTVFHYECESQPGSSDSEKDSDSDLTKLEMMKKIPLQRSTPDFLRMKDISETKSNRTLYHNPKENKFISQEFSPELLKDEPFLNSQPEVVPVILHIKDDKTDKQSPLPPPPMQVRTNVKKSSLPKKEKKTYNSRVLVEVSTQNDFEKPSIFNQFDTHPYKKEYLTQLSVPPKKKPHLYMSNVFARHIPVRIVDTGIQATKIMHRRGDRVLVYGQTFDLEPAPPPPPIVIEPDPETMETIRNLQERLMEIQKSHNEEKNIGNNKDDNNNNSSASVDRGDMFTQMRIAIIDSNNKLIARQKELIKELMNRKPEVVYKTQILKVPDTSLDPIDIRKPMIRPNQIDFKNDPSIPKKPPSNKMSSTKFSSISSVDVYTELAPIKYDENDDEEYKVLFPPPVYKRPPPTPLKIDLESVEDDEAIDDPFGASIQMLYSNIKFMANFGDNENHIVSTMKSDTGTYESFLMATGSTDTNVVKFMDQIKENESCLTENVVQLDHFAKLQLKLLNVLKMAKRRALNFLQAISDFETAAAATELSNQQQILKDFQNDKSLDPKASNLLTLQKLEDSMKIVEKFPLSSEDNAKFAVLSKRVQDTLQLCIQQKPIQQKTIDNLMVNVQSFISSIKPQKVLTSKEIISSVNNACTKEMKNKMNEYKASRDRYKAKLSQEQENCACLEAHLRTVRGRLNEEKEINQNTVSLYQSQIQMLKGIFETLNIDPSKDPLGIASAVRNEVLSLQSLLETSSSERDVFMAKVSDLEDIINSKEGIIKHLSSELEETQQKILELETTVRKNKQSMMFHETDIEMLRKEKDAESEIGFLRKSQLQEVISKNSEINNEINSNAEKISKLKNEIRLLKDEKDDLEIKIAIGKYKNNQNPNPSIATQTILRIVGNKKPSSSLSIAKNNGINDQTLQETNSVKDNNVINDEDDNISQELIHTVPDTVPPLKVTPQASPERDNNDDYDDDFHSPKTRKVGANHNSEVGAEEEEEEEIAPNEIQWEFADLNDGNDADAYGDQVLSNDKRDNNNSNKNVRINVNDEKVPEDVHKPLDFKVNKTTRSILDAKPKKPNNPNIGHPPTSKALVRPKPTLSTATTSPEDTNLAIGISTHGKRPLPGTLGKIKPTISGRTALTMKAAFSQHPGKVIPVESARNYRIPNSNNFINRESLTSTNTPRTPKTPKTPKTAKTPKSFYPCSTSSRIESADGYKPTFLASPENVETIRITRIEYIPDENKHFSGNNEHDLPLVSPISRNGFQCDPMSVSGVVARSSRIPDFTEFEKVTQKLQQRIQQLQKSLANKDSLINALKRKFAELFRDKQKCQMKSIRINDNLRRCGIRYENAQNRLDIVMKELNIREDENTELKQEIIKLRSISHPAKSTLYSIKEFQMKQEQLKREKQRKQVVLAATMSALGKTNDSEVKKNLGTLLGNTQKSITRIEAKRRKYRNIERKQVYGALAALSLINDRQISTDSIAATTTVSKWNQSRTMLMKSVWNNKNMVQGVDEIKVFENKENENLKRKFPSYAQSMKLMDKIQPPLTIDERRMILRGEMNEELADKIAAVDTTETDLPIISGKKFS